MQPETHYNQFITMVEVGGECDAQEVPRKRTAVKNWTGGQKPRATPGRSLLVNTGRDDWIRTSDPLLPKQVRYQGALRSYKSRFLRNKRLLIDREI